MARPPEIEPEGFLALYVRPDQFPWLVTTTLDVMYGTALEFNMPALSTIEPKWGYLQFGGRDRYEARSEVVARLATLGVRVYAEMVR